MQNTTAEEMGDFFTAVMSAVCKTPTNTLPGDSTLGLRWIQDATLWTGRALLPDCTVEETDPLLAMVL